MAINDGFTSFSALSIPSGGTVHIYGTSSVSLGNRTALSVNSAIVLSSVRTFASPPTGQPAGSLSLCFAASGISLIYSRGSSVYIVGQSATSGAVP
jgi:hypothetical protein